MHFKILLSLLMIIVIFNGCTKVVSINMKEVVSTVVVYFSEKEIIDPILYPNKSKEEIQELKSEMGKMLLTQIWGDFGFECNEDESVGACRQRATFELKVWIDNYTDEFVKDYELCVNTSLDITYEMYDLLTTFKDIDECLLQKNIRYKILIDKSKNARRNF